MLLRIPPASSGLFYLLCVGRFWLVLSSAVFFPAGRSIGARGSEAWRSLCPLKRGGLKGMLLS